MKLPNETLQQRAWAAMRHLRTFSLADVLVLAARGEKRPEQALSRYLRRLIDAGFCRILSQRGGKSKTYRLVKDCGEFAPKYNVKKGRVLAGKDKGND